MKICTDFNLWFEFLDNPYQESGELGCSWGRFGIRVNGKELWKEIDSDSSGLEWNLIYLYQWLNTIFRKTITPSPVDLRNWPGAFQYYQELDEALDLCPDEDEISYDRLIEKKFGYHLRICGTWGKV